MKKILLYLIVICNMFVACKRENVIVSFDPMVNFPNKDIVELDFDMTNAVFEGLVLPHNDSMFHFSFTIKNNDEKKYYYKIYYQNTSYAFDDKDSLSYENFYGSWENTDIEFKPIASNTIIDSFQIVGNPRSEQKYFGKKFPRQYKDEDIEEGLLLMQNDSQWYESVKQKAKQNNVDLKEQMYKDLLWNMESNRNSEGDINRRERRNPRVGNYEFMLVIVDEQALKQIPDYIKDISKTNNEQFVNPFDYFKNKGGKKMNGVYYVISPKKLKAVAKYKVENGVYINRATYPSSSYRVYPNNHKVGDWDSLYRFAHFEEFYHNINTERNILQVQKIADIQSNSYTLKDYINDAKNTNLTKKKIHPNITEICGKNIRCVNNTIELINPASKNLQNAKKENVGIKGRVPMTYGKYIYKIKFPNLLNKSGLWNGLTNAAWLIYYNESSWNNRRQSKNGYVIENYNENEQRRINNTHYSEIDIEMIKTSEYWPAQKNKQNNINDIRNNGKFVLATTNWDLADGDNTFIKKHTLFDKKYKGKTFTYNRWSENSRNLTSRIEVPNEIFNAPYYYYVIEWKPKEIIWYIGKDLNNLQVVGYMSDKFTSIPNNQMLPVITQEYHYSEYWPPVIYEQGLLPYSVTDTKGILYELIIE